MLNEDNMYGFLMDYESKQKFIEVRNKCAESRGEERDIEINKLETAKSLLKDNVPLDIIKNAIGYNETYLKTLKI